MRGSRRLAPPRSAQRGSLHLAYWQSKEHEVDFVLSPDSFLEVKRGRVSPLEFAWFPRSFPKGRLTVVAANAFETERILAMTLERFMLQDRETA